MAGRYPSQIRININRLKLIRVIILETSSSDNRTRIDKREKEKIPYINRAAQEDQDKL